tara:strand:+ start:627 stop:935 length:309 start_codon:yes stop_codon:yes gene_type:complete
MKFGIDDRTWQEILSVFSEYKEIKKASIFGSRAKGTFKKGSDIDIVLFGENITTAIILDILTKLDDTYIPQEFDIIAFSQIDNPDLIDHIESVGIEIYEDKS